MRTKADINSVQCEKCGKICREGDLLYVGGDAWCEKCCAKYPE